MLTPTDLARYQNDGILSPIPVLNPAETHYFRSGFQVLEARLGGHCPYLGWSHLFFNWANELVIHPAILDAVSAILGDEILVHGSLALCKYPGDEAFVAWHQDGIYSDWHASSSTTAWIALTEADRDNGCMRVIPGSHRQGVRPHAAVNRPGNLLGQGEEIKDHEAGDAAWDVVLQAGEMALMQNYTIHGSDPNRSSRKRIGFIARYATPDLPKAVDPVILARGDRSPEHLQFMAGPAPAQDDFHAWQNYRRRRMAARSKERR